MVVSKVVAIPGEQNILLGLYMYLALGCLIFTHGLCLTSSAAKTPAGIIAPVTAIPGST